MSHSRWASSGTASDQQAKSTSHTHTHKKKCKACHSYFPLTTLITVSYKIGHANDKKCGPFISGSFYTKKKITMLYEQADISLPIII